MNKKRILMCSEFHNINSGFGRYTKEILTHLYNSNKYEIAELASYLDDNYIKDVPWKVYPNMPAKDSEDYDKYKNNPIHQFGQYRFEKVVLHFKPDIVFDVRDYWMFSYQELSPLKKYYHWIVNPTIDSIPQKTEWLNTFENADIVLTHTDWASNYLTSLNRNINLAGSASDSVDPTVFKPITWTKNYHKAKFGIPQNSFIIGSVMRNQKRKLISELFASLRHLISKTKNNNIFLYLHTSYPESNGWDIPELLQEHGVYNNVIFSYYSQSKNKLIPSLWKGPTIINSEDNSICFMPNVIKGLSDHQLSDMYNLFDIYVQYAICEGLGIPQLEAAACGIPLFAVNYSGMEEIIQKVNGTPIDYVLYKELETGSDRAVPINEDLVDKVIAWIAKSSDEKEQLSLNTRKLLTDNYSWQETAKKYEKIFDSLEPKNIWDKPMVFNTGLQVPNTIKSNRDFVYFIVDNILKEPNLKKTFFVENLIRSMDTTYASTPQGVSLIPRDVAIKPLETFMNNKIYCEKVRSGQIDISEYPYLNK